MTKLTWITPIVFIAVMLGGVGVAQATGAWITSGKQVVVAGQLTADDIKGSMTLQQAADGVGMPFAELVTLWLVLAATLAAFWKVRKAAGALLVPYFLWVSFAAALNFTIWRLNS